MLPAAAIAITRGKWSLLYVGAGGCAADCREALYHTRQVRRALGKEMGRVERMFVTTGGVPDKAFLEKEHSGLVVIEGNAKVHDAVLASLGRFTVGDVFVADPLGNLVLRFPAGTPMKDMYKDLNLLLKASQIG